MSDTCCGLLGALKMEATDSSRVVKTSSIEANTLATRAPTPCLLLLSWLDGPVDLTQLHLFCHFLTFLLLDVSLGNAFFFLYCG
jgi:hypothetical protein